MKEIDEMDMLGFLRVRAWGIARKVKKVAPKKSFIDQVWPSVKP